MKILKLILYASFMVLLPVSLGIAAGNQTFKAKLTGKEVVPAVKTAAKGEAIFKLSKDGKDLTFTVTVTDIENVTAAHIHGGKKGKNGAPVINLFTGPMKEGKFSGELATGTITDADLFGSLQGKTVSDVVKMIKAGDFYVNVHTEKYPDGEIRGQIR